MEHWDKQTRRPENRAINFNSREVINLQGVSDWIIDFYMNKLSYSIHPDFQLILSDVKKKLSILPDHSLLAEMANNLVMVSQPEMIADWSWLLSV